MLGFNGRNRMVLVIAGVAGFVMVVGLVVGLVLGLRTSDSKTKGGLDPPNPTSPLPPSNSVLGVYWDAAVASNGYPCAVIGRDVLMKNGSAVDAAIATLFCEGVACPQSMGLGGGFLMTIYDRQKREAWTLNARETAPGNASENMYHGNAHLSQKGGLAVAVPGELRGYSEAHKLYGRLDWRDLIQPTIDLCRDGFLVTPYLAGYLTQKEEDIMASPTLAEILINPNTGKVWKAGDKMRRTKLAETLEKVAIYGADALYTGELGKSLAKDIQDLGGIISEDDLASYSVRWENPIQVKLQENLTLYTVPPPGSGVLVAFILSILNRMKLSDDPVLTYQRITETFKFAYGRRTELGDTHFINIDELVKNLTSPDYAEAIRAEIEDVRTWDDPRHYGAVVIQPEDHGTAHISVLAPNGDAVSVTSTVNLLFGALVRSTSTGIILNNEMDDFSAPDITNAFGVPPSPANFIVPGKRPLSSMCPSIFVDNNGDVRLVVGAAGGTKITTATALVALHNLWLNHTIKEAVDANRIHHQLFPMELQYEFGMLDQHVRGLEKIGHKTSRFNSHGSSTVTAIAKQGKHITANGDFRRQSIVAGF